MSVWDAIKLVSSGVTLAAFLGAVAYAAYRFQSRATERLIKAAPEKERGSLVQDALKHFRIDTTGLTKEQQYNLALEQIRAHASGLTVKIVAVCFIAVIA